MFSRLLIGVELSATDKGQAAQNQAEFNEIRRSGSAQRVYCLHYLQRVPDGVAERLLHIGDNGSHGPIQALSNFRENRRQFGGFGFCVHKGTATTFNVE